MPTESDRPTPVPVEQRGGYWQNMIHFPRVLVVMASTNEPQLSEALLALRDQTFVDFMAHVIVDCADRDSWEICRQLTDDRFFFTFSPVMQGLARVWNHGITSDLGDYLLITGGECILPADFLECAVRLLDAHPEYVLVPTVSNESLHGQIYRWNYTMTRATATAAGPFGYEFGPGGVSTVADWSIRACTAGAVFAQVTDLQIQHRVYSVQDKADPNLFDIEGMEPFRLKYANLIVNQEGDQFHPYSGIVKIGKIPRYEIPTGPAIWDKLRGVLTRGG